MKTIKEQGKTVDDAIIKALETYLLRLPGRP